MYFFLGCDFFGPTNFPIHGRTFVNKFFRLRLCMYFLFVRCVFLARGLLGFFSDEHKYQFPPLPFWEFLPFLPPPSLFLVFPGMTIHHCHADHRIFVVDSAGVAKRVSKLSARFYRYKKQIAAGNMDPMPRVSVKATHPAVTARSARWQSSYRA